jgi:hypothetical protein
MNIQLNCPVCGYTEIEGNICPNCDTELSLLRMLQELPQVEKPRSAKVAAWQLTTAVIILLIGMGLGTVGCFLFIQPQSLTATVTVPSPVVIITPSPKLTPIVAAPVKEDAKPTTYIVKSGDNLSAIAEKFCGQGTSWQVMVKVNPQLKGQEDYIDVGQILKLPTCKGGV